MNIKRLLNHRYITYIYLLILLLGSVLPINSGSSALNDNYTLHIRWDYLLHALVYMPLPALLVLGMPVRLSRQIDLKSGKMCLIMLIIFLSVIIPVLFELVQKILPFRTFNINDLMANMAGVILGITVTLIFRRSWTSGGQ